MKLSKVERLILANQFQLLSVEENDYYSKETCKNYSTILLEGYEFLYDDIFSGMDEIVSSEKCRFVLDVLNMYRTISNSYLELSKKGTDLTERDIAFKGFDGNNETGEYSFLRFFIKDYNRFEDLEENEFMEFNSHWPSIEKYEKRLDIYNNIISSKKEKDKFNYLDLTEKDIKSILKI
jgi:hypothetical protein